MESIQVFKSYMSDEARPNHIKRFCRDLKHEQWSWFYGQMQEPASFVTDFDRLLYILKWILKYDFNDLSYEILLQEVMNPEGNLTPLIKDEWWPILCERYQSQLDDEFRETQHFPHVCESAVDIDDNTIF